VIIASFSGSSRAWTCVVNQVFNRVDSKARVRDWNPYLKTIIADITEKTSKLIFKFKKKAELHSETLLL